MTIRVERDPDDPFVERQIGVLIDQQPLPALNPGDVEYVDTSLGPHQVHAQSGRLMSRPLLFIDRGTGGAIGVIVGFRWGWKAVFYRLFMPAEALFCELADD